MLTEHVAPSEALGLAREWVQQFSIVRRQGMHRHHSTEALQAAESCSLLMFEEAGPTSFRPWPNPFIEDLLGRDDAELGRRNIRNLRVQLARPLRAAGAQLTTYAGRQPEVEYRRGVLLVVTQDKSNSECCRRRARAG
jgi:hypothetical protein